MDDNELKARLTRLRVPPADVCTSADSLARAQAAFGEAESAGEEASPWTWREWLWPSPLAWGAMTCLWLAALAHEAANRPARADRTIAGNNAAFSTAPLVASRDLREMIREFQSGQPLR